MSLENHLMKHGNTQINSKILNLVDLKILTERASVVFNNIFGGEHIRLFRVDILFKIGTKTMHDFPNDLHLV